MKRSLRIALLAVAVVGCGRPVAAQDSVGAAPGNALESAVQAFDRGTAMLEAGDHRGAIRTFESALDLGYSSVALQYNLGIAYFRMDEIGRAIRAFERARRLDPDNRLVLHNLDIARLRLEDRISALPTPIWTRTWQRVVLLFGVGGLFGIGLTAYFVAIGATMLGIWSRRTGPWIRRVRLAGFVVGGIGIAAGLLASVQPAWGDEAVVLAEEVSLYPAADSTGSPDMQIHEGLLIEVLNRAPEWTAVRLPNGVTGWVASESLGPI
jgi:tetratricopeptide (TPR) repeat protein